MAKSKKKAKSYSSPFAEICAEMNEDLGEEGDVVCLWDEENLSKSQFRVSTGSNLFDMALGGGLPSGRIVEIMGWEATGKTTMKDHLGASAQAQGGYYFDMDAEAATDQERGARIGVIPDRYMYGRVDSVEHGFKMIRAFVENVASIPTRYKAMAKEAGPKDKKELLAKAKEMENVPSVIGWDTISVTPTAAEMDDKGKFSAGMSDKAREIRSGLRKITNLLADNNILLVLNSHLIEQIGRGKFTPQPDSPGGHAIKFWASARIELKHKGIMSIRDREVGKYIRAKVRKSKFSPPGYEVIYPLNYMNGIDRVYECFDYLFASKCGVVTQAGAYYYVQHYPNPKDQMALYYADLHAKVQEDPALLQYLLRCMSEVFYGTYQDPTKKPKKEDTK